MVTIAIANQKGGTGKTTTAVTLAHRLAMDGYRVLVVDTDVQGHVAAALGMDKAPGIYRLVQWYQGLGDLLVVQARENLDIIPGDKTTEPAKRILASMDFRERVLADALESGGLRRDDHRLCPLAGGNRRGGEGSAHNPGWRRECIAARQRGHPPRRQAGPFRNGAGGRPDPPAAHRRRGAAEGGLLPKRCVAGDLSHRPRADQPPPQPDMGEDGPRLGASHRHCGRGAWRGPSLPPPGDAATGVPGPTRLVGAARQGPVGTPL